MLKELNVIVLNILVNTTAIDDSYGKSHYTKVALDN